MKRLLLLLLLVVAFGTAPASADRDIAYAARYYTLPASHRTSHFHLYRINPDGTGRTQLTYGDKDDTDPHWSPDGRRLVFLRGKATVCEVSAHGTDLRELAVFTANDYVTDLCWLPNGRTVSFIHYHANLKSDPTALWFLDVIAHRVQRWANVIDYADSPDGRWLFLDGCSGPRLLSFADHRVIRLSGDLAGLMWLDRRHLIGLVEGQSDTDPVVLQVVDLLGHGNKLLLLKYPKAVIWAVYPPDDDGSVLPSPNSNTVVWALNEHNSTVGTLAAFFQVFLTDGAMHFLAQGQFLIWSPDGKYFCTAPGRDTWTYKERRWDGTYRTVWAAPLQIGTSGGKLCTLTPGLVWVTGADWRKRKS